MFSKGGCSAPWVTPLDKVTKRWVEQLAEACRLLGNAMEQICPDIEDTPTKYLSHGMPIIRALAETRVQMRTVSRSPQVSLRLARECIAGEAWVTCARDRPLAAALVDYFCRADLRNGPLSAWSGQLGWPAGREQPPGETLVAADYPPLAGFQVLAALGRVRATVTARFDGVPIGDQTADGLDLVDGARITIALACGAPLPCAALVLLPAGAHGVFRGDAQGGFRWDAQGGFRGDALLEFRVAQPGMAQFIACRG
ncbi:hypothetical protein T492DRAFT_903184, partial [Pavlovales sp. CCMP2436]